MKITDEQRRILHELIGEGIHTGLRKAVDSPQSATAWHAIHDLPPGEWGTVIEFALDMVVPWLESGMKL